MDVTPETVASAVSSVASSRGKGTLPNLMAFARALKQLGIKVSLSQVLDVSRSVDFVDIGARPDFRALLRANLISQKEDFPVFDMAFDCFWREQTYERMPMETLEIQGTASHPHTVSLTAADVVAIREGRQVTRESSPSPSGSHAHTVTFN